MSYRPTQTPAYWTEQFQLTADDLEFLQSYFVQNEKAFSIDSLVKALIEFRYRREEQRIRRDLARGSLYQPKNDYEVGETLVFPAIDLAVGVVVNKRPGKNPEHGDFNVIQVQMEGADELRSFATSLATPHKLNRSDGDDDFGQEDVEDAQQLIERYGAEIGPRLTEQLLASTEPQFIRFNQDWLQADLLADVHVGHLNIAEALIEVQSQPLPTAHILKELDLPTEMPPSISMFSVDFSMSQDERFVDVGVDSSEWHLKRLLPEEALKTPRRLIYRREEYDRSALAASVALLQIEWEMDDEWTEGGATSVSVAQLPNATITINYPHRRSGTLPLTERTRSFFPVRSGKRSMITFVDGRWGQRFPGWVAPQGRYVCGLTDWYEQHQLPVGAYVILERTNNPREIVVDFRPRRMKREWVRMAFVEDNQLVFRLHKQPIASEYDELQVVGESAPSAIDKLRRSLYDQNPSTYDLIAQMAPNLMGLSTEGVVHAKTLYSGVNMIRRTAPGPVFAALASNPSFRDVGGGLFALARP